MQKTSKNPNDGLLRKDVMTADDKSDARALKADGRARKDDLTIDDLRAWVRKLRAKR